MLQLDAEALYADLREGVRGLVAGDAALVGIWSGGAWLAERLQRDLGLPGRAGALPRTLPRHDSSSRGLARASSPSPWPATASASYPKKTRWPKPCPRCWSACRPGWVRSGCVAPCCWTTPAARPCSAGKRLGCPCHGSRWRCHACLSPVGCCPSPRRWRRWSSPRRCPTRRRRSSTPASSCPAAALSTTRQDPPSLRPRCPPPPQQHSTNAPRPTPLSPLHISHLPRTIARSSAGENGS